MKKINVAFLITDQHDGLGGLENTLTTVALGLEKIGFKTQTLLLHSPRTMDQLKKLNHVSIMPEIMKSRLIQKAPKIIQHHYWKLKFIHQAKRFLTRQFKKQPWDILIILNISKNLQRITGYLKKFKNKNPQIPVVAWPHTSFTAYSQKDIKNIKLYLNVFDNIFAISEGIKIQLESLFQLKNIAVVYNPISVPDQIPIRDPTKFIYIGRVHDSVKQVDKLLENIAILQGHWTLDIFGGNSLKKDDQLFQQKIDALKLQNKVTFHGWKASPWDYINSAGILLLNSAYEGFGLVLVEAMMRGIPCISSNCPVGPSEIIQQNLNGWLYELDDYDQLRQYLQAIIGGSLKLPTTHTVIESVQHFSEHHVLSQYKKQILMAIKNKQA